jgi:hypothetical protein
VSTISPHTVQVVRLQKPKILRIPSTINIVHMYLVPLPPPRLTMLGSICPMPFNLTYRSRWTMQGPRANIVDSLPRVVLTSRAMFSESTLNLTNSYAQDA